MGVNVNKNSSVDIKSMTVMVGVEVEDFTVALNENELSTQLMKKSSTESYKKNWLGPARKIEEGVWESSFHNRVCWCLRTLENRMTSKQEQ